MNPDYPTQTPIQLEQPVSATRKQGRYDGRIDRLGFFLGHVILFAVPVLLIALYALVNLVFSSLSSPGSGMFGPSNPAQSFLNIVLFMFTAIYVVLSIFIIFSIYIRRLHDINVTGWLSVLLLLSPASLILYIVLQAMEGTEGPNKYGSEERPRKIAAITGFKR